MTERAEQFIGELLKLIANWREIARRARPLECAPLTSEKRKNIAEWMHYTNRANELEAVLSSTKPPLADPAVRRPPD